MEYCPHCGSERNEDGATCPSCGVIFAEIVSPSEAPGDELAPKVWRRGLPPVPSVSFGVSTLCLLAALLAMDLAIAVASPTLGVILGLLILPPLIRTHLIRLQMVRLGRKPTRNQIANMFFASAAVNFLMVCALTFAASVAFASTCVVVFVVTQNHFPRDPHTPIMISVSCAGIVAITVIALIMYQFFHIVKARWQKDLWLG